MTANTQDHLLARRVIGVAVMLAGVALLGYGAHFLIRNGTCSSTGYTEYGPVPKCQGAEALYITSVFFLGPALALVGWLVSRTQVWVWPLTCVSLAAGLGTIEVDSTAASGAKSLGLILGVCFLALAVVSVTRRVRKHLRPAVPAFREG